MQKSDGRKPFSLPFFSISVQFSIFNFFNFFQIFNFLLIWVTVVSRVSYINFSSESSSGFGTTDIREINMRNGLAYTLRSPFSVHSLPQVNLAIPFHKTKVGS